MRGMLAGLVVGLLHQQYLLAYEYGAELVVKLVNAMK